MRLYSMDVCWKRSKTRIRDSVNVLAKRRPETSRAAPLSRAKQMRVEKSRLVNDYEVVESPLHLPSVSRSTSQLPTRLGRTIYYPPTTVRIINYSSRFTFLIFITGFILNIIIIILNISIVRFTVMNNISLLSFF